MRVPILDERVAEHAKALLADSAVAEAFLADSARESYSAATAAIASVRPFESWQALALAKIGFQYISKLRLAGANGIATLLVRWKRADDGVWVIAAAEDISTKRSPWSDIQHYSAERGDDDNG